ncbi:MAG: type II toxin-antitoxin system VapC family toxin [Verrucomicrobiae bacterium]|nr:type II toxin-antitoxin system VapC family toxin [Verrucomicrobiae bacterium]
MADSSIVLSWLLSDEPSAEADLLLESLGQGVVAEAPVLLRYEVPNALVSACIRRNRITKEGLATGIADFESLPIRIDAESGRISSESVSKIAVEHSLSVYDAAYLEVAQRRSLPLATRDQAMKAAGKRMGIAILS